MPKKKKTRKQKIIADVRHKQYVDQPITAKIDSLTQIKSENMPIETKPNYKQQTPYAPQQNLNQAITTSHYTYLYSDLLKTLILTFSIIIAELLIRYLFFGAN